MGVCHWYKWFQQTNACVINKVDGRVVIGKYTFVFLQGRTLIITVLNWSFPLMLFKVIAFLVEPFLTVQYVSLVFHNLILLFLRIEC